VFELPLVLGPLLASGTPLAVDLAVRTTGGGEMNILYLMGVASVVLFILGFLGLE